MKKFKLLSSLLAVVMVLSMICAMPVGAAQIDRTTVDCDFEDLSIGDHKVTEYAEAGIKWVKNASAQNDGSLVTVVSDETYGHALQFDKAVQVGVGLEEPVTTGKVRLGFSFKAGTLGFLQSASDLNSSGIMGERYIASIQGSGTGSGNGATTYNDYSLLSSKKGLTVGNWYWVEVEVDVDLNKWTVYVDGKEVNSYTLTDSNGADPLPQFQAFNFYRSSTSKGTGLIDNLTVTYETEIEISNIAVKSADGEEISTPGSVEADDEINVTANVDYKSSLNTTVAVIYAFYKDDELVAADVADVVIPKGESEINNSFTIKENVDYDEVKAFIWDGLTTMTPLTVAKSYPAN